LAPKASALELPDPPLAIPGRPVALLKFPLELALLKSTLDGVALCEDEIIVVDTWPPGSVVMTVVTSAIFVVEMLDPDPLLSVGGEGSRVTPFWTTRLVRTSGVRLVFPLLVTRSAWDPSESPTT